MRIQIGLRRPVYDTRLVSAYLHFGKKLVKCLGINRAGRMIGGGGDGTHERFYCHPLRIGSVPFHLEPLPHHRQFRVILGRLDEAKLGLRRRTETASRQTTIADNRATLRQEHRLRRGQSRLPDLRVRERPSKSDGRSPGLKAVAAVSVSVTARKQRVRGRAKQDALQIKRASFKRRTRTKNRNLIAEDVQGLTLEPL